MEFVFLRIVKGQLAYCKRGLSLYIVEPNNEKFYDSIEIYEESYEKAYHQGIMIKDELNDFLFERELYTPFDDMEIERLKKENEELKISAYNTWTNKRELHNIKTNLRNNEKMCAKISFKKNKFYHLTCEGVADLAKWSWIIETSTFRKSGELYNWDVLPVSALLSHYENSSISTANFRSVARYDNWRSMWSIGKKIGSVFDRSTNLLTRDQITLCAFSAMYDNVYENPEPPSEFVINDDDCLDGWFIEQRRKYDKQNKERQIENRLAKTKAGKAGEIFLIANSPEEIKDIHSLNSGHSEGIRQSRMSTVEESGAKSDLEFNDVRTELMIKANQESMNIIRGKARE